jgi:hypothetical protein
MTEAQAIELISNAFVDVATGWPSFQPTIPMDLANEADTTPTQWVFLSVGPPESHNASMGPPGSKRQEFRGFIAVQIFSDPNVGDKQAAGLADDVRKVLANKSIGTMDDTLTTFAGSSQRAASDGRWNQRIVVIPYVFWAQA